VNPDFIKSNYLTCSNQNVKKIITKIYDGKQMVIHHKVASRISKTRCIYIPVPFRERPTINLYYHVIK
jgi:hypothetical protein